MLQPKRTKYRKAFKGRIHGKAKGGTNLDFGAFGLKAQEPDRLTARDEARGQSVDSHFPGRAGFEEADRSAHGIGKGRAGILGGASQTRQDPV